MPLSMQRRSSNYKTFTENNNALVSSNIKMPKSKLPAVVVTRDMEMGSSSEDFITGAVSASGVTPEERDTWGSKFQFICSLVAYAVGLGNLWRFPYLCQQYGGGAFLIPYFTMLVVEGIPLFLLELGIGQKMRMGSIGVWNRVHPLIGGVGIASALVAFLTGVYYIVIITWCLYYVISSFALELPWTNCPDVSLNTNASAMTVPLHVPKSECGNPNSSASAYFWYRRTLDITEHAEDLGGINFALLGCFTFAWAFMFVTVCRGIKGSGNVIYFTSLFPYAVLSIFFVRAITLKGAWAGLKFMFTPKMHVLTQPIVWLRAATQIFFSLGLGFGSLISFGSYSQQDSNVKRDSIAVSCINCFTSLFAAVVIFSVLGFKATHSYDGCVNEFFDRGIIAWPEEFEFYKDTGDDFQQVRVDAYEVIRQSGWMFKNQNLSMRFEFEQCDLDNYLGTSAQGAGLVFIIFADAITKMPGAPFWAIIFFAMLLTLGIGSMIGNLEGVITPINDLKLFPWMKRYVLTAIVCLISYFVGIIFVTRGGQYWLKIFDDYAGTFSLTTIALCELVAISWIYGVDNFVADIEEMCGVRLAWWYWKVMWKYVGPLLMAVLLLWSFFGLFTDGFRYARYALEYAAFVDAAYPTWIVVFIICLIAVGILPIPFVAIMRKLGVTRLELSLSEVNAGFNTSASTQQIMGSMGSSIGFGGSEDEDLQLDPGIQMMGESGGKKAKIGKGGGLNGISLGGNSNNLGGGYKYNLGQIDRLRTDSELSQQLP